MENNKCEVCGYLHNTHKIDCSKIREDIDPGQEIDRIHDQEKDRRSEEDHAREIRYKSSAQETLITKIMKSGKILDKEYRSLAEVLNSKVVTTYDAAVFIEYVLGMLKFRRHFFNGRNKAYKKCFYCKSRDNIQRYLCLDTGEKLWICETCSMNLKPGKWVPVKFDEVKEASADLIRKSEYDGLTPAQEDLIHEHREQ